MAEATEVSQLAEILDIVSNSIPQISKSSAQAHLHFLPYR